MEDRTVLDAHDGLRYMVGVEGRQADGFGPLAREGWAYLRRFSVVVKI